MIMILLTKCLFNWKTTLNDQFTDDNYAQIDSPLYSVDLDSILNPATCVGLQLSNVEPDVAQSSRCVVVDTLKPSVVSREPIAQTPDDGNKNCTQMNYDTNAKYWEQMYMMMKYLSNK